MMTKHTWLLAITVAGCDAEPAARVLPPREDCALAVVNSDYSSTAISLLTADGQLCAPDVITSGSRPPTLLTALSGDVVLPFEPAPSGELQLIDRYPNGVITTLDPASDAVTSQTRASVGFAGNPQDIAFTPTPLVARLRRSETGELGSDLVALATGDTVDLTRFADPGLEPMPTRFARANGLLWVGLTHLSADFTVAGPGRVIGLDPTTFEGKVALELPFQNCGNIASIGTEHGLWVVCSGLFAGSTAGPQIDHSGIAYFEGAPDDRSLTQPPTWFVHAAHLGDESRPLGFTITPLGAKHALVVALGDLATDRPDRLLLIERADIRDAKVTVVAESDAPFQLGAALALPNEGIVLLADGSETNPRIRRFEWAPGPVLRELDPIVASDTGLPPRHIARFKP